MKYENQAGSYLRTHNYVLGLYPSLQWSNP